MSNHTIQKNNNTKINNTNSRINIQQLLQFVAVNLMKCMKHRDNCRNRASKADVNTFSFAKCVQRKSKKKKKPVQTKSQITCVYLSFCFCFFYFDALSTERLINKRSTEQILLHYALGNAAHVQKTKTI